MVIGVLTAEFRLSSCHSLKDKRRALSGLRDRTGRHPNVAVCESDYADDLRRAQWSFVTIGPDRNAVDRAFVRIEELLEKVDADIADLYREYL